MASIDELNFKAILDDKDFLKAIERDKMAAKELNTSLSKILDINKKTQKSSGLFKGLSDGAKQTSAAAKQINKEMRELIDNLSKARSAMDGVSSGAQKASGAFSETAGKIRDAADQTDRITKKEQEHTVAVRSTNSALLSTRSVLNTLSQLTGVYFGAIGIRQFLSKMIDVTGQFEVQKMALRTMLRDVDGADRLFEQLYQFSSDSTYRFSELAQHAKQLAGFGIEKNSLLDTTKMLGDVASGLGVSIDRLILAYGHVKSSGFLRGIQLRSFSQNGVPILEELAKLLGEAENKAVSLGEVFDRMTKREIPFEMVEEAFKRMTSEGGKFYQMQEVLSRTLAGQINILKGRWENMMYAIGQSQEGILKGTVSSISNLIKNYDRIGKKVKEIIAVFGTYKAVIIAAELATNTFVLANHRLLASLSAVLSSISANPYALLAVAVTTLAASLYKLVEGMRETERYQKILNDGGSEYRKNLMAEQSELDYLYQKLKTLNSETDEYQKTRRELESRFGPYIEQLRNEGVAVDNLATLYENLTQKINESQVARYLEKVTKNLTDTFAEAQSTLLYGNRQDWMTGAQIKAELNLDAFESAIVDMVVLGQLTKEQLATMDEYKGVYDKLQKGYVHTGEQQDSGPIKAINMLDRVVKRMESEKSKYVSARQEIEKYAESIAKLGDASGSAVEVPDWVNKVTAALTDADEKMKKTLTPKDNEGYFDYLKRVGGEYKEINEYKDKALKADKQIYESQLATIKAVDKALEGNILSDARVTRTPWKGSGKESDDEQKKQIQAIKNDISILEKLREAYQKLEPYFGDKTPDSLAEIFGGDKSMYTAEIIDGQIIKLIGDLRQLGRDGEEAADIIENRVGVDVVNTLLKQLRAEEAARKKLEAYNKALREWQAMDFNLAGTGAIFDINKLLSDFNSSVGKIENKYVETVKKAEEAHKGNAEAIEEETKKLGKLRDDETEYVRKQTQEKLTNIAKTYFKDLTDGLDMRDWGDKTYQQVKSILSRLNTAQAQGLIDIPEEVKEKIEEAGLSLEDFIKLYNQLFANAEKNVNDELMKKTAQEAKKLVGVFGEVGSSIKGWGESLDNDFLRGLGEAIGKVKELGGIVEDFLKNMKANTATDLIKGTEKVAENMSDVADAAKDAAGGVAQTGDAAKEVGKEVGKLANTADWITLIIKVVLMVVEQIVNAVSRWTAGQFALVDAMWEYRDALYEANLLLHDSVFGEDTMGKISAAWENAAKSADRYNESLSSVFDTMAKSLASDKSNQRGFGYDATLYREFSGGLISAKEYVLAMQRYEGWMNYVASLRDAAQRGNTFRARTLQEVFFSIPGLMNYDTGEIDYDLLKSMWDKGWADGKRVGNVKLSKDVRLELENLLKAYDQFIEQQKEFTKSMKDLFGDLASTIADDMVDAFIETGDALGNLEKSFEDFGENVARIMVRSFLTKRLTDMFAGDIEALGKDYFGALETTDRESADRLFAERFATLAANMKIAAEEAGAFVNSLLSSYFQSQGLLSSGEGGDSGSVGKGIQSITEDTANLLASYINATRADVSVLRAMQEAGWQDVKAIREALTPGSAPTYNEYMAQIAANTHDNALAAQEILLELRAVIGGPASTGNGVRVYVS